MNWILLSPPPLSANPDTPQNLERAQEHEKYDSKERAIIDLHVSTGS